MILLALRSNMDLINKRRLVCVSVFDLQLYLHGPRNSLWMSGLFQFVRHNKTFRTVAITNENNSTHDCPIYNGLAVIWEFDVNNLIIIIIERHVNIRCYHIII